MAALVRHGLFKTGHQFAPKNLVRSYVKKPKNPNPEKKLPPKIESAAKSLAAKGFLRSQKEYLPPKDVLKRFSNICVSVIGSEGSTAVSDPNVKFNLLSACQKEFNHSVPNSLLHTMESTDDILLFYNTPVNTTVPLDMMKNLDLPDNLHILYDYHRFHPDTDTKFNGVTAFPRSSTLVTGLKYREKYAGHTQKQQWPFN